MIYNKNIWIYSDEHEIEVSNFEIAKEILESLGLKELVSLDIEKNIFIKDDFEIVLEDVKDLGLFLEVEYLKDTNSIDEIKKGIWNFIESLNIRISNELHEGKPQLMLRKLSSKN